MEQSTMAEFYFGEYLDMVKSAEGNIKIANKAFDRYKETNLIDFLVVGCSSLNFAIQDYKMAKEYLNKAMSEAKTDGEFEKLSGGKLRSELELKLLTEIINLQAKYYDKSKIIVDYIIDKKVSLKD